MDTISPLPPPVQHPNTSSSPMLQAFLEKLDEQHQQQLQTQEAAVVQKDNDPKQSHLNPCSTHGFIDS